MKNAVEIPKNSRESIRVERISFQGHDLANIRVWFKAEDGEMRPSKKGIAVKLYLVPDLIAALQKVAA